MSALPPPPDGSPAAPGPVLPSPEARRFGGRAVIVTGGASGIGLAAVRRFAAEGACVVIADQDADAAARAADTLRAAGAPDAAGVPCDVADEAQVRACVAETMGRFGRLDVLVNNAGLMVVKAIPDLTADDWRRVMAVDLLGAFFFVREAFAVMRAGGAIVNVASVHAVETTPQVAAYAAAKAGLVSLTRSASLEGHPRGLRVNAVLPGAVDTPMLWDNPNVRSGLEAVSRAAIGSPDDIAAAIAYLASDDARFVQGAVLVVDGGRLDQLGG